MSQGPIFINGRFLAQRTTGVQRYAREVVRRLDAMVTTGEIDHDVQMLLPRDVETPSPFAHIPARIVGGRTGHRWEQTDLAAAVGDGTLVSLGNTGPLRVRRQVVTIHDASVFAVPASYTLGFRVWYRMMLKRLGRRCAAIVTPSRFSKDELVRWCGLDPAKITVTPLGVEHMLETPADQSILREHDLERDRYVLGVGGAPHKNLPALLAAHDTLAERGVRIVIVGGSAGRVFRDTAAPPDVLHLGYCTDGQLRALYEHAACLVFPSFYEGFGLPPLEAMACGCPVIASNAASLPEVCGDAAVACDPADVDALRGRLGELIDDPARRDGLRAGGRERATTFSWDATARGLWETVERQAP